ncbi:MAG: hypothetical protein WC323_02595 [Patescibacteria group bacterium]|jgi:hypothetical protein
MGLKDLPKLGSKFRAKSGPGSFLNKIKRATRYGELKGLQDNIEPIVETMREYQGAIRKKGGMDSLQRKSAWKKIKQKSQDRGIEVTKQDARDIKKVLEHFDPKNISKSEINKEAPGAQPEKTKRRGSGIFSFRRKEEKPPVAKYLRALDRGYEDQRMGSKTGVSIESIRGKGSASRLRVDTSKSGSRSSGINPITGAETFSRGLENGQLNLSANSNLNRKSDVNPLSGSANHTPLGGSGLNSPSIPNNSSKIPPTLAI